MKKYEMKYGNIYRDKEWVILNKKIEARNDQEAIAKTHVFIEMSNKYARCLEKFELVGLERIDQERITAPVSIL